MDSKYNILQWLSRDQIVVWGDEQMDYEWVYIWFGNSTLAMLYHLLLAKIKNRKAPLQLIWRQ